jgi:hypothetical protein
MTSRERSQEMLDSIESLVLIRMMERNQTLPDDVVKIISLELLFEMERLLRGIPVPKPQSDF